MNTRKSTLMRFGLVVAMCGLAACSLSAGQSSNPKTLASAQENSMQFGNFSVSLAVKDIQASKAFYDKLDFKQVGGDIEQNWIILQNGTTTIGLFQGMFEENIMTFNPGWNHKQETLEEFDDVRDLQAQLKMRGLVPMNEAIESENGTGSFMLSDPDGNTILVDQHVDRPN